MNTIKKRDVTRTKKLGVNPILTKLCNLVLAPTAAIAINKHHLLKLLANSLINSGTKLIEFKNAKKIKSITNIGTKGIFLEYLFFDSESRENIDITKTIGNNNVTLYSLTNVEVSPVRSDMENPAPTT